MNKKIRVTRARVRVCVHICVCVCVCVCVIQKKPCVISKKQNRP